ncbi:hypothetical protein A3H10_00640 [Candidatus Uhrbacteria bacterium RIFCSPLOWO2_12_FULL_46_10]|nr:MAG: hypothetical protein A3H10_00640 [Candidatus Uhrbacteria bacterium RIFCSPLOWO2_12_FULL_46_10]
MNNISAIIRWQSKAIRGSSLGFARALIKKYPQGRLYLVGGFVRDLLLGRPCKDIDFVVTGVPRAPLVAHLKKYGRVNFVGRTFGVFKFVPNGQHGNDAIDIALPRLDLPKGRTGAYRDVKVISRASLPIEDDLRRRDFTINALAWNIFDRRLIDLGFGLKDLGARKLRTVGKPEDRFREDFSRMLRGLRFAAELDFSIELKTRRALKVLVQHLNDIRDGVYVVPREVLAKELLRAFYADPVKALELYDKSGALRVLVPEMTAMKTCPQPKPYHMEGTVWRHTELALAVLASRRFCTLFPERPDAELIIAILWHDLGKPYTLKTPKEHGVDRIRFDGHDAVGGEMAKKIAERLKLASPPVESYYHVNPEHLEWLIGRHLLLLHDRAREMKLTTIEKYFVRHHLAQKLQQLILVDSLATIPKSGRPVVKHLTTLWKILDRLGDRRHRLPNPLLNGDNIMSILNIPSGPMVGLLLRRLREQQLLGLVKNKKQAAKFVKREHALLES